MYLGGKVRAAQSSYDLKSLSILHVQTHLVFLTALYMGTIISPHLQKRKLRWRETESFQHYTASVAEVEILAQGLWLEPRTQPLWASCL